MNETVHVMFIGERIQFSRAAAEIVGVEDGDELDSVELYAKLFDAELAVRSASEGVSAALVAEIQGGAP